MKDVTPSFLTAIDADVRRVVGKVEIEWTDAKLDTSSVTASSIFDEIATPPQQAFDDIRQTARKLFALSDNKLDGSYHPLPADGSEQVGWWSGVGCDTNCIFNPAVTITAEFSVRTVSAFAIAGDKQLNEYPVDFSIKANGSIVKNITGNNLVEWSEILEEPLFGITSIQLVITKWNKPNRLAKITEFYSPETETIEGEDLISMDILEERELSNGSLPIGNISANELTLELNNIDYKYTPGNQNSPVKDYLLPYRRIKAWLGVEYDVLLPSVIFPYTDDYSNGTFENCHAENGKLVIDKLT